MPPPSRYRRCAASVMEGGLAIATSTAPETEARFRLSRASAVTPAAPQLIRASASTLGLMSDMIMRAPRKTSEATIAPTPAAVTISTIQTPTGHQERTSPFSTSHAKRTLTGPKNTETSVEVEAAEHRNKR